MGKNDISKSGDLFGSEFDKVLQSNKNIPVRIWTEFNHTYDLPQYETSGASGLDIRANESVIIPPNHTMLIPTGIFVDIPDNYEIQVRPRSGLSLKTPLRIGNSPGTIDSCYRGEIGIIADNTDNLKEITIACGDRIAQLVLQRVPKLSWIPLSNKSELTPSDRGDKGFGHTGVKQMKKSKFKNAFKELRYIIEIQGQDKMWNYDHYMLGFYNGLILAQSIFTKEEPKYRELNKEEI